MINKEYAYEFLQKLRKRNEGLFLEAIKLLLQIKNGEIQVDILIKKVEDLFISYPDLHEELILILDTKRLSSLNSNKRTNGNGTKNLNLKSDKSKEKLTTPKEASSYNLYKEKDSSYLAYGNLKGDNIKNQINPEYLFFDNLKHVLDSMSYMSIIKLLHLYNEGVLNHSEFCELCEPYLKGKLDLYNLIKQITLSKQINRKSYSYMSRPLSEIDFSSNSFLS